MTGWIGWTPETGLDEQVAVIHLAHHLAEIVTQQGAEFAREALAGNPTLEVLNITPDRFTALLDRTIWVVNQVRAPELNRVLGQVALGRVVETGGVQRRSAFEVPEPQENAAAPILP